MEDPGAHDREAGPPPTLVKRTKEKDRQEMQERRVSVQEQRRSTEERRGSVEDESKADKKKRRRSRVQAEKERLAKHHSEEKPQPHVMEARRSLAERRQTLTIAASLEMARQAAEEEAARKKMLFKKPKIKVEVMAAYRVDASGPALPSTVVSDKRCFVAFELWALSKGIKQRELCSLYAAYAGHYEMDDPRKPKNVVSLTYFQDFFDGTTAEAASLICIPAMFHDDVPGLKRPDQASEVDFCRFAMAAYSTACLSPLSLLVRFFGLAIQDVRLSRAGCLIPLRPFEELVSLVNGGLNKALLLLLSEAFGSKNYATFEQLLTLCLTQPVLLWPIVHFQRLLRRRLPFGPGFWDKHVLPCADPDDPDHGALFRAVNVPPAAERIITETRDSEEVWRLTARRLAASSGRSYWMDAEIVLKSEATHAGFLKKRASVRLFHLFRTLAFDDAELHPGSLRESLRTGGRVPLRRRAEYDVHLDGWTKFDGFYYHNPTGLATRVHPDDLYEFGGALGRLRALQRDFKLPRTVATKPPIVKVRQNNPPPASSKLNNLSRLIQQPPIMPL